MSRIAWVALGFVGGLVVLQMVIPRPQPAMPYRTYVPVVTIGDQ